MKKNKIKLAIIIAICIFLVIISLTIGSYELTVNDIIKTFLGKSESSIKQNVFYNLRLPRVIMGLWAGLILGIAGSVYQVIFANPLASPDLTGVAKGASLGATFAIVVAEGTLFEKTLGAFVFALGSLFLVLFLVKSTGGKQITTYILAGIIISSLADAGIMILKYMADPLSELASIEFWTMGSLAAITLDKTLLAIASSIIPFGLICFMHQPIVILSLGDENARYIGLNARVWRMVILLLTTWMVASVIAITGVIAFVGLIAPHITYLILKKRTGCFYITSGLIGAIIIVFADMLSRTLISGIELPLSVFTILFSAPLLLFWMYRQRGKIG